jgi:hypothetical protein
MIVEMMMMMMRRIIIIITTTTTPRSIFLLEVLAGSHTV